MGIQPVRGLLAFCLSLVLLTLFTAPALASSSRCQFQLGFLTLRDLIGHETVGRCLENERYNAIGDSVQHTTGGLLVWRKDDNWTAFTDGYRTWINGPNGLVMRLNTERFEWEADYAPGGGIKPLPTPTPAPAPPAPSPAPAQRIDDRLGYALQVMFTVSGPYRGWFESLQPSVIFADVASEHGYDYSTNTIVIGSGQRDESADVLAAMIVHELARATDPRGVPRTLEECILYRAQYVQAQTDWWRGKFAPHLKSEPLTDYEEYLNTLVELQGIDNLHEAARNVIGGVCRQEQLHQERFSGGVQLSAGRTYTTVSVAMLDDVRRLRAPDSAGGSARQQQTTHEC